MGYVTANLLPDEQVVHQANLHWIVFVTPVLVILLGVILLTAPEMGTSGALVLVLGIIVGVVTTLNYSTSEFAVTNKRILAKVGLIRRRSLELNLAKVESIEVNQDIVGRILDYGTLVVVGSGGTREPFKNIADPMALRLNAQKQAAFAQATSSGVLRREERECPACGEVILAKAKVCKHCKSEVTPLTV